MPKGKPEIVEVPKANYIAVSDTRMHHEIYLSDARKVARNRLKTVIRHPVRKKF